MRVFDRIHLSSFQVIILGFLLVILLGLYLIARQLGWTEFFQRFPTISGEQLG